MIEITDEYISLLGKAGKRLMYSVRKYGDHRVFLAYARDGFTTSKHHMRLFWDCHAAHIWMADHPESVSNVTVIVGHRAAVMAARYQLRKVMSRKFGLSGDISLGILADRCLDEGMVEQARVLQMTRKEIRRL